MPVNQHDFNYLEEVVARAEDLVRLENPDFVSGFHTISMQAHRVEGTIDRLQNVKRNLKEAEQILLENIAGLRSAFPEQKPKGTAYARRILRCKPLWQKVVSAHALNPGDDEYDTEEDSALATALKEMSPSDAKLEFERHDYTLRHKLQGIKRFSDLVGKYISMLNPRLTRLAYLENIGQKWTRRVFEVYDIEKIATAQKVVTDSSVEVKMIHGVLDIFPKDFTKLCELEDIGRGLKRKADWTAECETPETMKTKRGCTEGIKMGRKRSTRRGKQCATTEQE